MPSMDDLDDMVQNDTKKAKQAVRRYRTQGSLIPDVPTLAENVCWMLALTSVIAMIGTLPFVGPGKMIPGTTWIGLGSMGIVLFGSAGFLMRLLKPAFSDANRGMGGFNKRR